MQRYSVSLCLNIEKTQLLNTNIEKRIIYINEKFNDFDHLREASKKWSLDFTQLDSGKFFGELMLMDNKQTQLVSAKFNRKFYQEAETPKGYRTFGIPADQFQSFFWRGYNIDSNKILIVPKSGELEAFSNPGFNIYTISIADELIEEYRCNLGYEQLELLDSGVEVLELAPQSINSIRNQINYLLTQVQLHPQIVNKKAFQQIFKNEIPNLLLKNLIYHKSTAKLPIKRIRDISLHKAIDYLKACKSDFPSVKELCLISGASQRTLEYAFKERFDIGPNDYMKKQRLSCVNRALKKADPKKVNIADIARSSGFWHMGQFGADYKKFFGELPSSTLKK